VADELGVGQAREARLLPFEAEARDSESCREAEDGTVHVTDASDEQRLDDFPHRVGSVPEYRLVGG
jgi:hypothetical protein